VEPDVVGLVMPPPVKQVKSEGNGCFRKLGIPTVLIALRRPLLNSYEPILDPMFILIRTDIGREIGETGGCITRTRCWNLTGWSSLTSKRHLIKLITRF